MSQNLQNKKHSVGGKKCCSLWLGSRLEFAMEGYDDRTHTRFVTKHTGTGQRETQTINTHGGKWGTGGNTGQKHTGKTIRLVTQEEGQVT